jgi:hypothetical protein
MVLLKIIDGDLGLDRTGRPETHYRYPKPWLADPTDPDGPMEHAVLEYSVTAEGSLVDDDAADEVISAAAADGITIVRA